METTMNSAGLTTMSAVQEIPTRRFTSTFKAIDRVFGRSRQYGPSREVLGEEWGIARGKLVVLAGDPGVGKTRFYTLLAIMLIETCDMKVVIFQKEMSAGEYKEMVLNIYHALGMKPDHLDNLVIEQTKSLSRQIEVIRAAKPDLIIDDSFNLTSDPNAKTEKGIQEIVFGWKDVMGSHSAALFIAHEKKDGGIKGNNHLEYLADGLFYLKWDNKPLNDVEMANPASYEGRVRLVSGKNRQGKSGVWAGLQHDDEALRALEEASPVAAAEKAADEAEAGDFSGVAEEMAAMLRAKGFMT